MFDLTYVESLGLLVCALNTYQMQKEAKDYIREELQEKTGIEKVLVIEGSFEVVKKSEEFTALSTP